MDWMLRSFEPRFAATIASWVQTPDDLLRLAPRTPPPLTPRNVIDWTSGRGDALMLSPLNDEDAAAPCGYAEINPMKKHPDQVWMGHVIIAPDIRNRGIGGEFVQLLLREAFVSRGASVISLVVFPNNDPAIRCYLRCGFEMRREEFHRFRPRDRKHRMLRMDLDRDRWFAAAWDGDAQLSTEDLPILPER